MHTPYEHGGWTGLDPMSRSTVVVQPARGKASHGATGGQAANRHASSQPVGQPFRCPIDRCARFGASNIIAMIDGVRKKRPTRRSKIRCFHRHGYTGCPVRSVSILSIVSRTAAFPTLDNINQIMPVQLDAQRNIKI